MRSAPHIRLCAAISLIKLIVSGVSFGLLELALDVCFQNTRKSSRWKPQQRLWLDKVERMFPGPNHSGQEHQEKPVRLFVHGSFDLSMKDGELLSYERVFRDQFRFPPDKISERDEHKGVCRWFDPAQETFSERVKAEANSLLDGDDQTKRHLNLSFINRDRTTERHWILNQSDCTFPSSALARKPVQ